MAVLQLYELTSALAGSLLFVPLLVTQTQPVISMSTVSFAHWGVGQGSDRGELQQQQQQAPRKGHTTSNGQPLVAGKSIVSLIMTDYKALLVW